MNLDFSAIQQQLPGHEIAWLQQLRQQAFSYFENKGLPTRFDEDWKYAKTQSLINEFKNLQIKAATNQNTEIHFLDKNDHFILFVDGQFVSSNLPKQTGVEILSLAQTIKQKPQWLEPYI